MQVGAELVHDICDVVPDNHTMDLEPEVLDSRLQPPLRVATPHTLSTGDQQST